WYKDSAALSEQLRGVPVRCRDNRLSSAVCVCEGARGDLSFVQVGCNVDIRRADELLQGFEIDKLVVKDNVLFDLVFACQYFQADAVRLPCIAHLVRMCCPEDDINDVWKLRDDPRKR